MKWILPKVTYTRPTRDQLLGFSPSQFKTRLRKIGFKVPRTFYGRSCSVVKRNGRLFRFRWWSEEFVVDVSCPINEFDRWANSVDQTILVAHFLKDHG